MERLNAINNGIKSLAGADLARVEQEYAAQLHQLEQLRIYKEDYAEQLKQRLAANVSADEIQDYRYFFASLYRAISQQESIVRHLQQQLEECRREWLAKDQEVRKLNTLSDGFRKTEAQAAARLEQKQSDELTMLVQGRYALASKH
jgi:flagellar export protein FliJ